MNVTIIDIIIHQPLRHRIVIITVARLVGDVHANLAAVFRINEIIDNVNLSSLLQFLFVDDYEEGEHSQTKYDANYQDGDSFGLLLRISMLIKQLLPNQILLIRGTYSNLQIAMLIQLRHVVDLVVLGHHELLGPRLGRYTGRRYDEGRGSTAGAQRSVQERCFSKPRILGRRLSSSEFSAE